MGQRTHGANAIVWVRARPCAAAAAIANRRIGPMAGSRTGPRAALEIFAREAYPDRTEPHAGPRPGPSRAEPRAKRKVARHVDR